jgi:hypothetical protein
MTEGSEGRIPWVAVFALRWVSYEEISEVLSGYGLVTEKLDGYTFTQRRFADDAEREYVLAKLAKMGIDASGKEEEGWHHTDFYLSRRRGGDPARDATHLGLGASENLAAYSFVVRNDLLYEGP